MLESYRIIKNYFILSILIFALGVSAQDKILGEGIEGHPRVQRLELLRPVQEISLETPGIGEEIREAISNKEDVIFNQEKLIEDESTRQAREVVVSTFKSQEARELMTQVINSHITMISNDLKSRISTEKGVLKVSEVVVGAGPHGAAYVQAHTTANPDQILLVVDNKARPGGTFADVYSSFYLNSTNRANTGERARPGSGDLNYVHDIVGIPDYKGRRWVEAGELGKISSVGAFLGNSLFSMETEVTSVNINDYNASRVSTRYVVSLRDIKTGKSFKVYTDRVVFASGIGQPKAFGEVNTDILIQAEKISSMRSRRAPRVETFSEFFDRVGDPQNRTPLRDLSGKTVAIVGLGDSGRVLAELLTGLGPDGAYKADVAQVGLPKRIFWYVGTNSDNGSFRNCQEYIAQTRARYAQIAQALNSGVLIPVVGRATKIQSTLNGTQFVINHNYLNDSASGSQEIVQKVNGETTYFVPADERKGIAEGFTKTELVAFDKIILTTGFDTALPKVLSNLSGGVDYQNIWKFVTEKIEAFDGREVNIAREHINAPGVVLIGPANETLGGLPTANELAGVNANTVSLFANIERTKALAQRFARELVIEKLNGTSRNITRASALLQRVWSSSIQGIIKGVSTLNYPTLAQAKTSNGARLELQVSTADVARMARPSNPELALKVALDASFGRLKSTETEAVAETLVLEIRRNANGNFEIILPGLEVSSSTSQSLKLLLNQNNVLKNTLSSTYFANGSGVETLKVEIPVELQSGRPLARDAVVRIFRTPRAP